MTRLLILGATGQVGRHLLRLALADAAVTAVAAPTRRPLPAHPRLLNPTVDYRALPSDAPWWAADAAVCALGTTLRQAGSREAFREVDHDHVLAAARLARAAGTPAFLLTSSMGADPRSRSFYLRVKGETEADLRALGFASLTIVRPGLMDPGTERHDSRPAESLALRVMRIADPLLPRRWRTVRTEQVAAVLLAQALARPAGERVIESEGLGRG
ncbi:NAD(P)H-binding protein [Piscinibacter sakaiensis]|uniref:Oxidoreductase n=1 Tax=Piscinibacter sakaiensis TaxID=1547922 RepID=A0A0K8P8M1_PISS1|nr:NAD(P)H-binding protein [Piscinibacter sakaiensis]GAP38540.1 oxidoreductase [Piscinibacter sakaiensis]